MCVCVCICCNPPNWFNGLLMCVIWNTLPYVLAIQIVCSIWQGIFSFLSSVTDVMDSMLGNTEHFIWISKEKIQKV